MTPIAIRAEHTKSGKPRFRAIAGNRQSVGQTMGEALDSLTADWDDDIQEAAVLIQRFQPDTYFTATQYRRMQDLLDRRALLTAEERAELEALIDAEYELGRLSSGRAAELAGIPRVEFLLSLGRYKVFAFEAELTDLEQAHA